MMTAAARAAASWMTLLALPTCTAALCSPLSTATAMQRNTAAQDKVQELDEAAWKSCVFWAEARRELPGLDDDPAMLRFRGFCDNLRTCEPGDILTLDNGQELFTQYTFPGLIDAELPREPFPPLDAAPAWAETLAAAGAVAQEELLAALAESPLHDDDATALSGDSNPDPDPDPSPSPSPNPNLTLTLALALILTLTLTLALTPTPTLTLVLAPALTTDPNPRSSRRSVAAARGAELRGTAGSSCRYARPGARWAARYAR